MIFLKGSRKDIEIAAGKFLNRTFSSGSVCKSVVESRVSTCLMRDFLMRWVESKGVLVAVMVEVRCIVTVILQSARECDDRWKVSGSP
jgi:hypothetical protein